jgi:glutamate/tyrosine decarboxylase-like PLP-dependent enzyme
MELGHLKDADSITLDPHKSGYCPYPGMYLCDMRTWKSPVFVSSTGGGLCYRDERMRFLVTWTSPYLDGQQGGVESMGVYGLEGRCVSFLKIFHIFNIVPPFSKPGAAPVAAWVAASTIGLHNQGYGALLSTALFTAARVRLFRHWT